MAAVKIVLSQLSREYLDAMCRRERSRLSYDEYVAQAPIDQTTEKAALDEIEDQLNGCETDYSNMRKENDRLRALATNLRNRLYFHGENVDEADAILLRKAPAPPGKEE